MTKLPAILVEAEATAFARDWIAKHREPDGIFHPSAEEIYGKAAMKHWAQCYPSFGPDDIVYLAENGSPQADKALRELIAEYVQRGETPPVTLAAYNVRILNEERKKPGPGKAALFVRNIGITLLVVELSKRFGLSIYKNRASHRPTASTIAAATLTEARIGIAMGHRAVEKILDRFGPIYTGQFPVAYFGLYG